VLDRSCRPESLYRSCAATLIVLSILRLSLTLSVLRRQSSYTDSPAAKGRGD
jgi:hypothetical protein